MLEPTDAERRFDLVARFVGDDPTAALGTGRQLLQSMDAEARALGADILGQLATVAPDRVQEIGDLLAAGLDPADDAAVIASCVTALGHAGDGRTRDGVTRLAGHPDPRVRFAVAFALPALGLDGPAAEALRMLSRDDDTDVRDWATFGLAESDLTDPETRAALLDRVDDSDYDTRCEAIYGLAKRHDPAARALIDRELAMTHVGALILRARDELGAMPE